MARFSDKVVLITGGTGSFGKKFTKTLLEEKQPKKIIIFSRDELKQHEMQVGGYDHPSLRYFIGDIRDRERLVRAMHGVDIVVHAAVNQHQFSLQASSKILIGLVFVIRFS